nr:PI-PLC X domain-containing protein At5g67130-like isoform X1 [Ipomoea batatas]
MTQTSISFPFQNLQGTAISRALKLLLFFFIAASLFCQFSSLTIGETCSTSGNNCGAGLLCSTCPANGNTRPRCTRHQPTIPTTKIKGLSFNKYSWLTTHNSFAISGSKSAIGSDIFAPTNQEDSITAQLKNGVRGLMLDMYDFNNDIWLCHSFGGKCFNLTSFQPAINALKEIQVFLEANLSEIVTIFIEDYVASPQGLTKVFKASGLNKYWFPVSRMPKNGEDWPIVDDMIKKNQHGNGGLKFGSCPSRSESSPMNTKTISLVLQNYFPDNPNMTAACADNSAPLLSMTNTCYEASGKRWPNFIAVDFYQRNDAGGASEVVDHANGHLTCNCDSIAYCKINGSSTKCEVPKLSPPPPAQLTPTAVKETSKDTSSYSKISRPLHLHWLVDLIITIFF